MCPMKTKTQNLTVMARQGKIPFVQAIAEPHIPDRQKFIQSWDVGSPSVRHPPLPVKGQGGAKKEGTETLYTLTLLTTKLNLPDPAQPHEAAAQTMLGVSNTIT